MSSRTWMVHSDRLLSNEKLASVVLRLMIAMNDLGVTNSEMVEWQRSDDPLKRRRREGGILYFGRVQSAHLFEALQVIQEIEKDAKLKDAVDRCDRRTRESYARIATFLHSTDFHLMAKMRNVVAFHYADKLALRRLKTIVARGAGHVTASSLGGETLEWYFELGDLIADEIVIHDIFGVAEGGDIKKGAEEVLDRLHVIGVAFTDFAGHFLRAYAR